MRLLSFIRVAATLALALAGCFPTFNVDDKLACVRDADCIDNHVCVFSSETVRFGTCTPARVAGNDAGAGGDIGVDAPSCEDQDGDGAFTAPCTPFDCDDRNGAVRTGADEVCNSIDDDCDGALDEGFDLLSDAANCGGCGQVCTGANSSTTCQAGRCEITGCIDGWWDANGVGFDGCEARCNAVENACGDGRDDDCDGLTDSDDLDCDEAPITGPFAGDAFFVFAWDTRNGAEMRVGEATFNPAGSTVEFTEQRRTAILRSGRGEAAPDATWQVTSVGEHAVMFAHAGGAFNLYRSTRAPRALLAGVDPFDDTLYLLVLREPDTPAPNVAHSWLSWIASPYNELASVPNGGSAALGWSDPVELALLRLSTPGATGRGGVTWPFAEFRDSTDGDPDASTGLRSMAYTTEADGTFTLELHNASPSDIERVFEGAVVPGGDLAIGVHRFTPTYCTRRLIDGGQCIHDPIAMLAVTRSSFVGPQALAGGWRLLGVSVRNQSGALVHALRDVAFDVDSAGVVSGDVTGSAGIFGSNEAFLSPTTRIDLRGDAVGGGTLVLEGHVSSLGYGVFWDQSGATSQRPMNGGMYILVRAR